ncbi:N-acyl-L-amino acid amidohydrolase [Pseudohongiella acticola]|uniref:N-acyl-L-amino acid amidohydrolase n=2 Tax=Pseudohongiella acticola TaxID=1524254 RepID=A0A1E8CN40_9GAMM|nr:N-acyl-L-amino acid amidohydrolase [Pseudohongiella acticola]
MLLLSAATVLVTNIVMAPVHAQNPSQPALPDNVQARVDDVMPDVVAWRRDFHQHPELGNREFRTAGIIAEHLESLGMEVETGIAHTGVVGVLRGGQPGPVVALRADMDALPVEERVDLPFASQVTTQYNGQEVGVMHACGHDNHMAILMGAASVLAGMQAELPGTVMFIFQPAEEGAPEGEEGGAELMLAEGIFDAMRPDAVFGLHVWPIPAGVIAVREGGTMASSDSFSITVQGQQTHGAAPWAGIDPIVVASQIVMGLQTIPSRQLNATTTPSIVTVGAINGGLRSNIIPDSVEMIGTLRTFDADTRTQIHQRVTRTAEQIAASAGATAEVEINLGYPVTANDPDLTRAMQPTLQRVVGDRLTESPLITGAEDFSYYANEVPGMFFFLGIAADDPEMVYPNHSPFFYADESALPVGVQAMTALALDFLSGP